MTHFDLDERLAADSLPLCQTEMSLLRVSRDARFPWLILIPQRAGLADLVDLAPDDETRVMADVRAASLALRQATGCDKLNVASLGNMVRQLHVHIVARFEGDAAWPGPIWGVG
jgi:diadenosine tetraphosphate (Ap4A) HIT family hydrolase